VKVTLYAELFSAAGSYRDGPGSPRVTLQPDTWTKLTLTFKASSGQAFVGLSPNFSGASTGTVILYDDMSVVAS
jgi:hypothetical protein